MEASDQPTVPRAELAVTVRFCPARAGVRGGTRAPSLQPGPPSAPGGHRPQGELRPPAHGREARARPAPPPTPFPAASAQVGRPRPLAWAFCSWTPAGMDPAHQCAQAQFRIRPGFKLRAPAPRRPPSTNSQFLHSQKRGRRGKKALVKVTNLDETF